MDDKRGKAKQALLAEEKLTPNHVADLDRRFFAPLVAMLLRIRKGRTTDNRANLPAGFFKQLARALVDALLQLGVVALRERRDDARVRRRAPDAALLELLHQTCFGVAWWWLSLFVLTLNCKKF